jgi:predicted permease
MMRRRKRDDDIEREIRDHLDLEAEEQREGGLSPDDARNAAHRAFGNVALALEDSRAVWHFAWLSSLMQDIRFGLRGFRKSPGFTLTVIGTLALGLGALGASFSVFNALVLRPFAVRDPYSLYRFEGWGPGRPRSYTRREFEDFRRENPAFSEVVAYLRGTVSMAGKGARVQAVTSNYFSMLGGRVCMGRPLMASDEGPSADGVAVVSYAAWRSRLGADPAAVGTTVRMGRQPVEIVGVACPGFNGVDESQDDFWLSLPLLPAMSGDPSVPQKTASGDKSEDKRRVYYSMIGRLKPGLTQDSAKAALLAYGRQTHVPGPGYQVPERVELREAATIMPLDRDTIGTFLPEFAAFGLVLLIACANVSNMMLARGLARQREIGIRISLGAGRARMVRQLLTESLLLALPAALAASGVAWGAVQAARWLQVNVLSASPLALSREWNGAMDWRVAAFLTAAAVVATVGFGLLPALQAARPRLIEANRRSARLRSVLVLAQVAVCTLLLIASGVAMRAERRIAHLDSGMDTRGVFYLHQMETANLNQTTDRIRALPMFESIGYCFSPPLAARQRRFAGPAGEFSMAYDVVSPEYFDILRIPIRGRNFTRAEGDANAPVAIVSESTARRLWPHQEALGQTVRLAKPDGQATPSAGVVIGIARDSVNNLSLYDGADRALTRDLIYFPLGPKSGIPAWPIVRAKGDPDAARRPLERVMAEMYPNTDGDLVHTPQRNVDAYLYPYRALAAIAGILGALALLLTVSGVFGVSSYAVAQRRKEFGIRIALGADSLRVTGMVVAQNLRLGAVGAAVGALAALGVARMLSRSDWVWRAMGSVSMRNVDVFDAGGYAAGAAIVIAAAVAAAWVPARRAVKVDPLVTLRCD